VDYGFVEARTTFGRIGVKVWIYKGDITGKRQDERAMPPSLGSARPSRPRPPRAAAKPQQRAAAPKPRQASPTAAEQAKADSPVLSADTAPVEPEAPLQVAADEVESNAQTTVELTETLEAAQEAVVEEEATE
jgi:small subunit ribosomal protein S3